MTYREIITKNLMETAYDDVPLTVAIEDDNIKVVVYHLDVEDSIAGDKARMDIYIGINKITTYWRTIDDVVHAYEYALETL
jgi:hypothetical protein